MPFNKITTLYNEHILDWAIYQAGRFRADVARRRLSDLREIDEISIWLAANPGAASADYWSERIAELQTIDRRSNEKS